MRYNASMKCRRPGFTLLELLIVIAIRAILAAVTVISLNPAELLRKSRDAQRLSDVKATESALAFYVLNVVVPDLDFGGSRCVDQGAGAIFSHHTTLMTPPGGFILVTSGSQSTDGTGWIPVNLSELTGGSPIVKLPVDPSDTGPTAGPDNDFYYTYACNQGGAVSEIDANMESSFYSSNGAGDVESKDGGDVPSLLESGSNLMLLPDRTSTSSSDFYQDE